MESRNRTSETVLVNASWGAWYSKGTNRLERSAIYHGWEHDMLLFRDEQINEFFDLNHPYTIKAAAIMEAIRRGYTKVLWMDCSTWFVDNPKPIVDIIGGENGYFLRSGYNLAQTSA